MLNIVCHNRLYFARNSQLDQTILQGCISVLGWLVVIWACDLLYSSLTEYFDIVDICFLAGSLVKNQYHSCVCLLDTKATAIGQLAYLSMKTGNEETATFALSNCRGFVRLPGNRQRV